MQPRAILAVLGIFAAGGGAGFLATESDCASQFDDVVSVVFFDVGQGDSAVIVTPEPNEQVIVIDGGFRGTASDSLVPYLEGLEIDTIDLVILSHADRDHVNGLRTVLEKFDIVEIWDPGFAGTSADYATFVELAEAETADRYYAPLEDQLVGEGVDHSDDVTERFIRFGEAENLGAVSVIPLHANSEPDHSDGAYRVNASSIVVKVVFGENSVLFTGDAVGRSKGIEPGATEAAGPILTEKALLDLEARVEGSLSCTVLKVAHHGSETSSSTQFVEAVRPQWAVFSSTRRSDNNPDPATLARFGAVGSNLLRTGSLDPGNQSGDDHILLLMGRESSALIWRQVTTDQLLEPIP